MERKEENVGKCVVRVGCMLELGDEMRLHAGLELYLTPPSYQKKGSFAFEFNAKDAPLFKLVFI